MWRALLFLGLICLAAYGAAWLANNPETIAVTWAGREYSISLAVGVVGLVALAIALSVTLGTIRYVFSLPSMVARRSRRRRQEKGHSALSRGIVAVAAGDVAAARRHAGEAERLLGPEPLALLLKAQAAQASGNREGAEAAFREMADKPETRVLGLRGLYLEARRREDPEAARTHAEEATRIAPAIGWASEAVLEGYCADGDWAAAVRLIERRTSLGLVDRATSRRQRAVLLTADAQAREPTDPDGALAAAEQAVKFAPDLVPAAALAARLLSRRGDLKRAARIVETTWAAAPHPELAASYLNLRPGDSGTDRLRRAETLARLSSWSAESRFAIARAAIEARELPRAREVLRPLLEEEGRPTVRLCLVLAEIESRSGNAGGTREWLARAARAPRDKAWIADGIVSETWAPISPVTGRLDAFVWNTPPEMLGGPSEREELRFDPEETGSGSSELPAFLARGLAPPAEAGATSQDAAPPSPAPSLPVSDPPAPSPERPHNPDRPLPVEPPVSRVDAELSSVAKAPAGSGALAGSADAKTLDPADGARPPILRSGPDGAPAPRLVELAPTGNADPSASRSDAVAGPGLAGRARPAPDPVIFPVPHAPDDPGLDREGDRRQRFRLRV